jgi:stage II sporulation protein D
MEVNKSVKRFLLIISFIMAIAYSLGSSSAEAAGAEFIDVKIGKSYALLDRAFVSSDKGFELSSKNDLENALIKIETNKIYISINFSDAKSIDIFDDRNNYITTVPADGSLVIKSTDSRISVSGISYRGYLGFISNVSGLNLINYVDIESYLYGVVPKEIPALSSAEALKAQAVAARSFVYNSLNKHSGDGFNLCDTTHCQVYGGMNAENINTNLAVDDTYGIVATYNGVIANTVYHSSSGGYTESSEKVWGGKLPYLSSVLDPYSITGPNSNWSLIIKTKELESKLIQSGLDIGRVEGITITERTDSGRVSTLEISGSRGDKIMTGAQFRTLIGTTILKSTLFFIGEEEQNNLGIYAVDSRNTVALGTSRRGFSVLGKSGELYSISSFKAIGDSITKSFGGTQKIEINEDEILISGKGFGHGVGMSQYGAVEMAKQGFSFEDILKHYYRNIELTIFYR